MNFTASANRKQTYTMYNNELKMGKYGICTQDPTSSPPVPPPSLTTEFFSGLLSMPQIHVGNYHASVIFITATKGSQQDNGRCGGRHPCSISSLVITNLPEYNTTNHYQNKTAMKTLSFIVKDFLHFFYYESFISWKFYQVISLQYYIHVCY